MAPAPLRRIARLVRRIAAVRAPRFVTTRAVARPIRTPATSSTSAARGPTVAGATPSAEPARQASRGVFRIRRSTAAALPSSGFAKSSRRGTVVRRGLASCGMTSIPPLRPRSGRFGGEARARRSRARAWGGNSKRLAPVRVRQSRPVIYCVACPSGTAPLPCPRGGRFVSRFGRGSWCFSASSPCQRWP
jgi:hypothetical protein